jgi:ectoine hydroxylase-related dioxygenase (phytanoyl-CoA dioxygenase family)
MGPVQFCPGSHKLGLLRVHTRDPDHPDKTGAYGLILENREEVVARFPHEAPLAKPGDLIVLDFAVLHASGHNRSKRSRWSLQMRWFNFRDPVGTQNGWCGGFAAGVDFARVHPELVADTPSVGAGS